MKKVNDVQQEDASTEFHKIMSFLRNMNPAVKVSDSICLQALIIMNNCCYVH